MMSTPRRHTRVRTIATATVAALVTLALPGCTAASDEARAPGDPGSSTTSATAAVPAEAAPTPTPTPSPTYPLSTAPRTIPAVREHVPARGPGWKPTPEARVVVSPDDTAALSDEAKLLAGELRIGYGASAAPRAGDVELSLDAGASGGPESYTMDVKDGRVRINGPDQAGVFYGTRTLKQAVKGAGSAPRAPCATPPRNHSAASTST